MQKRILCLNPMQWKWIIDKGILPHVLLLNQYSYWQHYHLIHLSTPETQRIRVTDTITVWEFGRSKKLFKVLPKWLAFLIDELRYTWVLTRFVKKRNIDIIQSQEPYVNGIRGIVLKLFTRKPLVEDLRANYDALYKGTGQTATGFIKWRRVEKIIEWITYRYSDLVLGRTEDIRQMAIRSGSPEYKTPLVRLSTVAPRHFEGLRVRENLRGELGLGDDEPLVLYVGRFYPVKYPEDIIRCFEVVHKHYPDSVLFMVGEGPMQNKLTELADTLGLQDSVVFMPFLSQDRVMSLYYTADVNLCPLSGAVLTEALLSSKPVVAYDVDWHGEMVKNRLTGLLVKFRDYDGMARAVVKLLEDKKLARELGRNARRYMLKYHNPDVLAKREYECFDKLFARGKK